MWANFQNTSLAIHSSKRYKILLFVTSFMSVLTQFELVNKLRFEKFLIGQDKLSNSTH